MTIAVSRFAGDGTDWDRCVQAVPGWTHFHLFGWKRVVESVFGHECVYLAAYDASGTLAGVLPLVRVRSRLFGDYLVSMPFVNYGGPLGTPDAVRCLVAEAVALAERRGVDLLELRSRDACPIDLPVSHRKITVVLDLPDPDPDRLWKALPSKVRSQIRRPEKDGVTVAFGVEQLEPFYGVFARHMRDLGTPVLSRRLFASIAETFSDQVWFGCAYLDGKPVAGGCGFVWGDEFEMTWASALRAHNRIAPNMLLYWRFMKRCAEEGIGTFNFGRCTPGGGTHRFKRQWGSRDVPLYWYHAGSADAHATPSPDDGRFSWGPRMWRHLPVPLATALGPHIVRYLP